MTETPPKRGPDTGYAGAEYTDGRLSAPAALRNRLVLTEGLAQIAPAAGKALEIASGTGEHVVRFAMAMPGLLWQPTDRAPDRRASIAAWIAAEPSSNIRPPLDLDACTPGWAATYGPVDLTCLANLLHLVRTPEAATCLAEMAAVLAPGGVAAVYGPFLRNGVATSEGDASFDARIRAETPGAGYKDLDWVLHHWMRVGLDVAPPVPMPANNLLLWARKPATDDVT